MSPRPLGYCISQGKKSQKVSYIRDTMAALYMMDESYVYCVTNITLMITDVGGRS